MSRIATDASTNSTVYGTMESRAVWHRKCAGSRGHAVQGGCCCSAVISFLWTTRSRIAPNSAVRRREKVTMLHPSNHRHTSELTNELSNCPSNSPLGPPSKSATAPGYSREPHVCEYCKCTLLIPDIAVTCAMHHGHPLHLWSCGSGTHPRNPNPLLQKEPFPSDGLPLHLSGYYPPPGIHHMVAPPPSSRALSVTQHSLACAPLAQPNRTSNHP